MIASVAQAFLVDRIKRKAVLELHRTAAGEAALLEMYLAGESLPESDRMFGELARLAPPWLAAQLAGQEVDERRHADLLRARIAELGEAGEGGERRQQMALAAFKLGRLTRLVDAFESEFEAGRVVPLVAVVLTLERTLARVMRRHRDALESAAGPRQTADLLSAILNDETRHVRDCERALDRLVRPVEKLSIARLMDEAESVDRSFGVTGAVGMLALGVALRCVATVRRAAGTLGRAVQPHAEEEERQPEVHAAAGCAVERRP